MKYITLVLFVSMNIGCSTPLSENSQKQNKNHSVRNEKLLESFDVEKEVLEKFKVENNTQVKEVFKDIPKKTQVRTTIRPLPQKIKFTKQQTELMPKQESKLLEYPTDYPEKLIELNNTTKNIWESFEPKIFPGEKTYMDINYMGVSTGKIVISVNDLTQISGDDVYYFNAKLKTASYYSYLYELDDNIDSFVKTTGFYPLKYSMIQRESGQDIDDLQLFDQHKMMNYYFYKRVTSKKTKKNKGEVFIPKRFQDPLSIIFFLRGLPMKKGDVYQVPIVNKEKVIIFKTKISGVETIKTQLGSKSAIKMVATTKYTGDTLKSGDMTFWFSNDEKRTFLKFEAKIKIGSISGDIEKYEH